MSTKSKRQLMREQHQKRAQQQRLVTILVIVGIVVVVGAALIIPTIREATTPVGEFVKITPVAYPNASGLNLGDPNAKVKLDIFEDFRCSACVSYTQNIEPQVIAQLVETGQVYYVFHPYPFLDDGSVIKDSDQAAMASLCANEQERFWDYKAILFANSQEAEGEFSLKRLAAFAESLGLDTGKFKTCMENNTYQSQIDEAMALGETMGVTGTPSVFVNGQSVKPGYVPSFDDIKAAVDAALAAGG